MSRHDHRLSGTGGGEDSAAPPASREIPALGAGGEFDLIRSFFATAPARRATGVVLGAGDDAAVVEGVGIVLSCDLSIEQIHFRREWMTAGEIGYRAAAAALSDLAAMAARPIGVLVSLAATPDDADALATSIMAGVRELVEAHGGELLGGDVSRSPGPLILDVVAVGEAGTPITRSGGRGGHELWVTGSLGATGAAVESLLAGRPPTPALLDRFRRPIPRTREATWLAERGIPRAMLDLSDGLAGDVGHLAAASGVAVVLDLSAIPIDPELAASATPDRALQLALSGGEDYELLFAAEAGAVETIHEAFSREFGVPLTRIGSLEIGSGSYAVDRQGIRSPLSQTGFRHFGGPA